jgi:cyclohexadienyl dehydratase
LAFLVVRVPRGTQPAAVAAEARVDLASTGLEPEEIDRLAAALAALGGGR